MSMRRSRSHIPLPVLAAAIAGFGILYIPMMLMIIGSFNASRISSVWGGFSLHWYERLLNDSNLLDALAKSLWVGITAASISTLFGIFIALALTRFGGFRGRFALTTLAAAPIVMPDLVIGLSMLLLFIGMESVFGWPAGRGLDTIAIAHATYGMCFAAVVIEARLARLDPRLHDAARDLGAREPMIFLTITLPVIAPAVVAAWLLAFTLSFDDVIIASFTSGPGSSTLPIFVFSKVRLGVLPEINAVATLVFITVAIGVICGSVITYRSRASGK